MKTQHRTLLLGILLLLIMLQQPNVSNAAYRAQPLGVTTHATPQHPLIATTSQTHSGDQAHEDAFQPPAHPPTIAAADGSPSRYQPSAYMAGSVAVQAIFIESNGEQEPSINNWTPAQISAVQGQIAKALDWWRTQLPNAHLSFDLSTQVVPSAYEPIGHQISTEGQWISDALRQIGFSGSNYFEQVYLADQSLRQARHTNWATTIFVVNSASKPNGRFADGYFAYAYVGGPFLVVTSDAGPYGTNQIAPVVTHELGHIFGALDQYASASTPCTQQSGYLAVATLNSQLNNCGTHTNSIMLELLSAYQNGQIDPSALGQLGYRDSDRNGIPDPLDTKPAIDLRLNQTSSGRPMITGSATDKPFPSPSGDSTTIQTIARIEYRADGGEWVAMPPADGAYDSASETVNAPLALYDGPHTIELRAVNSIGAASSIATASTTVQGVGSAPAYTFNAPAINNTGTISLDISAPAGGQIQLSADPFFSGAAWAPATPNLSWQLAPNDGTYTLYMRFRDTAGIESPPIARAVLVDRTPPTGRAIEHAAQTPWLEIQAKDNASGIAAMQITADGASGEWQPFQSSLPATQNGAQLQISLRDAAGNVSAPIPVIAGGAVYLPIAMR